MDLSEHTKRSMKQKQIREHNTCATVTVERPQGTTHLHNTVTPRTHLQPSAKISPTFTPRLRITPSQAVTTGLYHHHLAPGFRHVHLQ